MEDQLPQITKSAVLLIVLLNPFLMSIYLLDLIEQLDGRTFNATVARGASVATGVFVVFAAGGDAIFSDVFQVRFASFLIFGGIIFLLIAIQFIQNGPAALGRLRGKPAHIAGSIAMPFMVGPGTVSASVLAGARLPLIGATASIAAAMIVTVAGLAALKWLHGYLKVRNAGLVDRYVDVIGRASALLIGTISVDMILSGVGMWISSSPDFVR